MYIEQGESKQRAIGAPAGSTLHQETWACYRQAVEKVILTMRERLSDDLSLDDLAAVACMSPYHFNRVFRQSTGIPPGQFLSALRLEAAKRLLLTTDKSVTEICFEVGYNSLGTFTSRFNLLVGLPPGQFRHLGRAFTTHPEELLSLAEPPPPPSSGPVLEGRVEAGTEVSGLIFLGLFETPIPQNRPVSCAVLARSGPFRIRIPERGSFFLFAAGMARFEEPLDFLRHSGSIRGLAAAGPFTAAAGAVTERLRLTLRPPDLLDPPLLVTLPLLIDERLAEKLGIEEEIA